MCKGSQTSAVGLLKKIWETKERKSSVAVCVFKAVAGNGRGNAEFAVTMHSNRQARQPVGVVGVTGLGVAALEVDGKGGVHRGRRERRRGRSGTSHAGVKVGVT